MLSRGGSVAQAKAGTFKNVAVIGAGSRGRSFAGLCVRSGFNVVLEDVLSSRLRRAEETFSAEPEFSRHLLRLSSSVEEAVRTADIAIDFVPDELESKLEIFSMMDRMAPPKTVFCTPTILSITDLASCTYRAPQCVAVVPFGDEIGLEVVLVRGAQTADSVVERVNAWFKALGITVQTSVDPEPAAVASAKSV